MTKTKLNGAMLAGVSNIPASVPSVLLGSGSKYPKGTLVDANAVLELISGININQPTVPTKLSQLENDTRYITSIPQEYVKRDELYVNTESFEMTDDDYVVIINNGKYQKIKLANLKQVLFA